MMRILYISRYERSITNVTEYCLRRLQAELSKTLPNGLRVRGWWHALSLRRYYAMNSACHAGFNSMSPHAVPGVEAPSAWNESGKKDKFNLLNSQIKFSTAVENL